jgi:hypothetical protein
MICFKNPDMPRRQILPKITKWANFAGQKRGIRAMMAAEIHTSIDEP